MTDEARVLLSCEKVNKSYGGVHAVDSASFHLRSSEILGLVGPNGAGKTTLVDIITGAQPADSGRVVMSGVELTGPPSRRARLGGFARTFQHPQLAPDLTVRDNALVGAMSTRMGAVPSMLATVFAGLVQPRTPDADRRISEIMAELSIGDIREMCADLTLGEQRLVEVGRALTREPVVILLDEPFAGGDLRGVSGIKNALQHLTGRGCGVLVVDHNVDIVASLVHRILLMDQGRIVFDGDPRECLRSAEMQRVYFGSGL